VNISSDPKNEGDSKEDSNKVLKLQLALSSSAGHISTCKIKIIIPFW